MEGGGGSSQGKPRQQVMAGREMHRQLPACRLTCPPPPPSLHPTLPAYPKTPTTNPPPTHPPTLGRARRCTPTPRMAPPRSCSPLPPTGGSPGKRHRRFWRRRWVWRRGGRGGVVRRFVLHATGMMQCQCRCGHGWWRSRREGCICWCDPCDLSRPVSQGRATGPAGLAGEEVLQEARCGHHTMCIAASCC